MLSDCYLSNCSPVCFNHSAMFIPGKGYKSIQVRSCPLPCTGSSVAEKKNQNFVLLLTTERKRKKNTFFIAREGIVGQLGV